MIPRGHKPECGCAACGSHRLKLAEGQPFTGRAIVERATTVAANEAGQSIMLRAFARDMYLKGYRSALEDAGIVAAQASSIGVERYERIADWLDFMASERLAP